MNINLRVRVKNPAFWVGLIGAVGTPILAYMGIGAADVTSWDKVGEMVVNAILNPYLLVLTALSVMSFLGVVIDPTTKGFSDSVRALGYEEPHDDLGGLK